MFQPMKKSQLSAVLLFISSLCFAQEAFVERQTLHTSGLRSSASLDIDNDGDLDIVTGDLSGNLKFFYNQGNWSFITLGTVATLGTTVQIKSADINNDGLTDLVFSGIVSGERKLGYLINSGGLFSDVTLTDFVLDSFWELGNLDGDEYLDLAVTLESSTKIIRNFTTANPLEIQVDYPNCQSQSRSIELADLNGDGTVDIVRTCGFHLGDSENFDFIPFEGVEESASLQKISDLNDDGYLDLIMTQSGKLLVFLNINNSSSVVKVQTSLSGIGPAIRDVQDIDADGIKDILVSNIFGDFGWLKGKGNGSFFEQESFLDDIVFAFADLSMSDLDDDGDLDLILGDIPEEGIRIFEFMSEAPRTNFIFELSSINNCSIDTVQFDNTSLTHLPDCTSWTWNFGDGNFSQDLSPSHVYSNQGVYNVTFQMCNQNGCNSSSKEVTTSHSALIEPDYSIPVHGLVGDALVFEDSTEEITNWTWVLGDGSISSEQSFTHVYDSPGTYTVELIITNSNLVDCSFSIFQDVLVTLLPLPEESNSDSLIRIFPIPFDDRIYFEGLEEGANSYSLFDITGREIQSGLINDGRIRFPSSLLRGTYFLSISQAEKDKFVTKVMK